MLSIPALSLSLSLSLCFTIPPSKLLLLLSFLLARAPSADAYCSLLSTLILLSALASLSLSLLSLCVFVSLSVNLSQLNLLNLALIYSVTFSLQHTFWYTSRMCSSLPS